MRLAKVLFRWARKAGVGGWPSSWVAVRVAVRLETWLAAVLKWWRPQGSIFCAAGSSLGGGDAGVQPEIPWAACPVAHARHRSISLVAFQLDACAFVGPSAGTPFLRATRAIAPAGSSSTSCSMWSWEVSYSLWSLPCQALHHQAYRLLRAPFELCAMCRGMAFLVRPASWLELPPQLFRGPAPQNGPLETTAMKLFLGSHATRTIPWLAKTQLHCCVLGPAFPMIKK
jgi:hypothetical protein